MIRFGAGRAVLASIQIYSLTWILPTEQLNNEADLITFGFSSEIVWCTSTVSFELGCRYYVCMYTCISIHMYIYICAFVNMPSAQAVTTGHLPVNEVCES